MKHISVDFTGEFELLLLQVHSPSKGGAKLRPPLPHRCAYTIREAARTCDVSVDTIKRRLHDERFPGADQIKGRTGNEWRIPTDELAAVALAEGWTLDLATAFNEIAFDLAVLRAPMLDIALGSFNRVTESFNEHRELQKTSAESLSALSSDLDEVRSDLENANEQTQATVGERDELAAKLAEAEASMGWWTRRKYGKA